MILQNDLMIILYVKDLERSKDFYTTLLNVIPCLEEPSMVEMPITDSTRIGLMPGDGIVKILDDKIENPNNNLETPRCELYIYVDQPTRYYQQAIALGATGICPAKYQNWGDYVAYVRDFDGNILAFASRGLAEG